MPKGLILIIDDERDLIELVSYNLAKEGYRVLGARHGESGLQMATDEHPDLIVLDLMLPGIDGLEVCRRLRSGAQTKRIPIIMLTAKNTESDRVVGLELGADDYVTKPFSPRELAARIKAVLRRMSPEKEPSEMIRRGDLVIDVAGHEVACGDKTLALTATEFKVLHFLASHPGRVFSRNDIIDGALARDVNVTDRTVDVHITALRRKLGPSGDWIETVRGFGYKFREAEETS